MDPDANLAEQRRLAAALRDEARTRSHDDLARKAQRLAELVEALDGWMSRGGFAPRAWRAS